MRVLIGHECSGRVRDAFRALGHEAYSCDLKESETISDFHIVGDVETVLCNGWDIAIFFPDCTYLAVSGLHWNGRHPDRPDWNKTEEAIAHVEKLWAAPIPKIAIENPVGCLSTMSKLGKPHQTIQPYHFGDNASKRTCLWLKGLPKLRPTGYAPPRLVGGGIADLFGDSGERRWDNQTDTGQNNLSPSAARAANRARTYMGIATAMAKQWG